MSELEKAFLKFANYGNTSTMGYEMTGKNFSKMCQECGVMDGKAVNSDDVDIAFNKVRAKGARTINYIEFLQGMKVLCGKRFNGKLPEDALQATFKLLEGKEPANVEANSAGRMSELEQAFRKFAMYGDTAATGNDMTGKNFSKMLKECGVMDGKSVTSTDVDIVFNKVKNVRKQLKKMIPTSPSKLPWQSGDSSMGLPNPYEYKTVAAGAVDRLTDTSKYTGSHKERFDESGKGKGIAGRADQADNSGYVGNYKGAGSYDKTH